MRAEGPLQIVDIIYSAGKLHSSFVAKNAPQDDKCGVMKKVDRYRPMGLLDRRLDFLRNHHARTHWPAINAFSKYQD